MELPLLPYAIPAGARWASSPGCLPEFSTLTLRNHTVQAHLLVNPCRTLIESL